MREPTPDREGLTRGHDEPRAADGAASAEWLARLQRITAGLARALSPEQVLEVVAELGISQMAPAAGFVALATADDAALEIARLVGAEQPQGGAGCRFPAAANIPAAEAVRTRQLVLVASPDERAARFPAWQGRWSGYGAWAAIPMCVHDRALGAMLLAFAAPRAFDAVEREFMVAVGLQCALALDRARLYAAEQHARRRAERLQAITAALSTALTFDAVARVILTAGVAQMGATAGLLMLRTPARDVFEVVAATGYSEAALDAIRRIPVDAAMPLPDAVRDNAAVWIPSRAALLARYPSAGRPGGSESGAWAVIPLVVDDDRAGGLSFGFPTAREFSDDDRAFGAALGAQCQLALERAKALADARAAARRAAFLARASEVLGSSLAYETTLQGVARLAVPEVADGACVDVLEPDGTLRRVAVAHVDPALEPLGRAWWDRTAPDPDVPGSIAHVARTGIPVLVPEVTDAMIRAAYADAETRALVTALGLRSTLKVPLAAPSGGVGTLTLVSSVSARRYGPDDLALAMDLARRAAVAIENARLFGAAERERVHAETASRAKDEFLAAVSHELRTPLTAILGWARMLQAGQVAPGRRDHAIATIERNARAQTQLIEDLLDISRVITGKLRLEVQTIEPERAILAALDSVRPAAEAKGVRLEVALDPGVTHLRADVDRLQQVCWNLLSNAVRHTPRQGTVCVTLAGDADDVRLIVSDTGEGIAPGFLPYVFDPFRQGETGLQRAHGGLGLGLAIVKHLVELHGGTVEAASDGRAQGARFTVRLPRSHPDVAVSAPTSTTSSAEAPASHDADALRGTSVLLVDDEVDTLDVLAAALATYGAVVQTARSAAEGYARFGEAPPAVVLCDLAMPGETGIDLIRKIRALPDVVRSRTPAIALTAHARNEDRAATLAAGFDAHLAKPIDPVVLVRVIAEITARHGASAA